MFGRHNRLHRWLHDIVPQPGMILLEQNNDSGGLRIERARGVEQCLLDDVQNLIIRDG